MMNNNKKVIKRLWICFIIIILIPFLAVGIFMTITPIARSNDAVRNFVFKKIPIETNWDVAINTINENKWIIIEMKTDRGLRINDAAENVSFASYEEMNNITENIENVRIVGTKSMCVELGEFYAPFHTAVSAYLAFNENDELVEVAIRRDIDSF